jgi:acyl-CoA thioesterase II
MIVTGAIGPGYGMGARAVALPSRAVDAHEFLGLRPTHNPLRWYLEIVPGICTDGLFLFGGCGLGAAIEALERTTRRPVVWAAAQYLSNARPPEIMDVDLTVAVTGHRTTQARAVAHVGDREVLTVNAALGARKVPWSGQWATMPAVDPPEVCPPRRRRVSTVDDSLSQRLEMRLAIGRDFAEFDGTHSDGHSALWARVPDVLEMSAGTLAILGDYVPFGVGQALGELVTGSSLDNTLRVCSLVPTEWVLVDVQVQAVEHGFGHGRVHLWAEDGTLLATAGQSCVVRAWHEDRLASLDAVQPTVARRTTGR